MSDINPPVCEVWWATPGQARPGLLALLDPDERQRHARFRFDADRDRYLVAHALARLVCARHAGCAPAQVDFTLHCPCGRPEPHGKPRPAGRAGGLEISISHSGSRVAVAVTRGVEVGVDVEAVQPDRDIDGLIDHTLTSAERAALTARGNEERVTDFYTYWTRKEALLKSAGVGLAGGLTTVTVTPPEEPPGVVSWEGPHAPARVWLRDLAAGPGYRAALAALLPGPAPVTEYDATELLTAAERR